MQTFWNVYYASWTGRLRARTLHNTEPALTNEPTTQRNERIELNARVCVYVRCWHDLTSQRAKPIISYANSLSIPFSAQNIEKRNKTIRLIRIDATMWIYFLAKIIPQSTLAIDGSASVRRKSTSTIRRSNQITTHMRIRTTSCPISRKRLPPTGDHRPVTNTQWHCRAMMPSWDDRWVETYGASSIPIPYQNWVIAKWIIPSPTYHLIFVNNNEFSRTGASISIPSYTVPIRRSPIESILPWIMSSARRLSAAVGMPMLWLMYRDWFMSNRCGHFGVNSKLSHRCIDSNAIEMRRGSKYRSETSNAAIEIVANKLGDMNRHYDCDGNKYFSPSTRNENHSHPFFSLVPLRCHVMWCHCCLLNGPHARFKCQLNRRLCFCFRLPFTKYHNTWAIKCI